MMSRKLLVYIAMSVDGYIASLDNGLEFLDTVNQSGEDFGYDDFISQVDTVIVGRKTYEKVLSMGVPYIRPNIQTYVITSQTKPAEEGLVFYNQNVIDLVRSLKEKEGLNIYCDGGAQLINTLLANHLIDELILFKIPCLLGEGIRLFQPISPSAKLQLNAVQSYASGVIKEHYTILKG